MTGVTRRDAMLGASAAAAVAGVPTAVAAQACDANLLALVEQFHDVYGECQDVWEKHRAHRASVEAMPDCPRPPFLPPDYGHGHTAFLAAHDAHKYLGEANRLNDQTGALAAAIFETPAESAKGALEKLKIAYTAVGDGEGTATGDNDLEAFQDLDAPWMQNVIADFERLIRGMRP